MSRYRQLVTVSEYTSHEALMADVALLKAAGLDPVAAGSDGRWRLDVDQTVMADALTSLGALDADPARENEYACPRCGASRAIALPPNLLLGWLGWVAALATLTTLEWWYGLAVAAVAAMVVLSRVQRLPHWRCANCSHRWNHDAEETRRATLRRAAE